LPITPDTFHRSREEVLGDMLASLQAVIPDVYVGEDGIIRILFDIESGQFENVFLANQLLLEDLFIQTAGLQSLTRYGDMFDLEIEDGTKASGTVTFTGDGATYIPIGTEIGYDPGGGLDVVYFLTTLDGTIPNPGVPGIPTVAINAAAGNLNGLYEYEITFVTASGETLPSALSAAVSPVSQKVDLTAIPTGGTGTIARRIYRRKNASVSGFRRVIEISDNVTTVYLDNITDGVVDGNPAAPTTNTANKISVTAEAEENGVDGNVVAGTITVLTNAPATLTDVTNAAPFTGGSDPEDTEDYRLKLLKHLQNPGSSSPGDVKEWAEEVDGVETATVFVNDNMGAAQAGHVTVRIAGPGGGVPGADVIAATQAKLDLEGIAIVTYHVTTFTAVSTNVTVDVTTSGTYTLGDVTPSVQNAIAAYINSLGVAETMMLSGIVDSVFGLPGISDVVVSSPGTNQTTGATSKRTPGTITVT
jgi:uncharacterized phage protein gp47/JayE